MGEKLRNYAKYSNLAFQIIAIFAITIFGGIKLDEWFCMKFPVCTLLGVIVGVIGASYFTYKKILNP